MRRTAAALTLALAVLGAAPRAAAETALPRVHLEFERGQGTDTCIDDATLGSAVEKRLDRAVFASESAFELGLRITLERDKREFRATVVLSDRAGHPIGQRELRTRARHCSALDDSLALVVALLVDSPEAREHGEPLPAPALQTANVDGEKPAVPPPPPNTPTPLTIPPDVSAPREPYRLDVVAAVAAIVGPLPHVALGPELLVAVRPPHFAELRLRPAFFPEQQVTAPEPNRGGRLSLVSVALDVCPLEHELERVRFSGCLGQAVGWVSARGFGYLDNGDASSLVYSVGAGAGAVVSLAGPLILSLELGLAVPLQRNRYVSRAADGTTLEVFRAGIISGTAAAGLGLEL
jgi:hypothetical protein